jgi:hypothetical protein
MISVSHGPLIRINNILDQTLEELKFTGQSNFMIPITVETTKQHVDPMLHKLMDMGWYIDVYSDSEYHYVIVRPQIVNAFLK